MTKTWVHGDEVSNGWVHWDGGAHEVEDVLLLGDGVLDALHLGHSMIMIRRSVSSDAQLSCTETRFQKCFQSGKNGSKHPMLSKSMAYNVISCKKIGRNTQKIKIADFTM